MGFLQIEKCYDELIKMLLKNENFVEVNLLD